MSKVVPWSTADKSSAGFMFYCPGCAGAHQIWTKTSRSGGWTFNGDVDAPTFSPSVLVTYNGPDADGKDIGFGPGPPARCHSFVTDGQIRFLEDCSHSLAGQTVALPDYQRNDHES